MTTPPAPSDAAGKAAGGAKAGGKGLVKSLKGHPPWLYAVIVVGAIAVAYMVRQRQNAAADAAMATSPDDTSTPVGDYGDTSNYPGFTQGAYTPGDEVPGADPVDIPGLVGGIIGALFPNGYPATGGGPPTVDPGTHTTPDIPVYTPPVDNFTPPVVQHVTPPPPPPPKATASGPQPTTGPGIFYNPDRKLRYIVQNTKGKNYRRYESKLNKGDWGQGGVIPQ